jgi:hypothetical protein
MNRELWLIGISSLILGLVLLLIVLAVLHRRRLNQISDQLAEGAVDNGETLKGVVERENGATRKHVSGAVDAIRNDTKLTKQRVYDLAEQQTKYSSETRGQLTSIKDRVAWNIKAIDVLTDKLKAIPGQVAELFTKKPPP